MKGTIFSHYANCIRNSNDIHELTLLRDGAYRLHYDGVITDFHLGWTEAYVECKITELAEKCNINF